MGESLCLMLCSVFRSRCSSVQVVQFPVFQCSDCSIPGVPVSIPFPVFQCSAGCSSPLGMESGHIEDHQVTASSSYDVVTGPVSARLNKERAEAWCPRQMVGRADSKEYLEIDLETIHVISATESQGRFGNGRGAEFVENYMLEYWRPGVNNWYTYKRWDSEKILKGNVNTYMVVKNELIPPILASKIRFVPFSPHPRTVCMRVEVIGCPYTDGLVSYSMPQGQARGVEVDLLDLSYDGTTTEGLLYGGLGQLHDGIVGDHNFRSDIGHGKGYEWVGWKNESHRPIEILCEFDVVRNFSSIHVFANNMHTKDVQVFSRAQRIYFSGTEEYHYMQDQVSEYGRNVTIKLHQRMAKYVKIQLFFQAKWILISEIFFLSTPAQGNFSVETGVDDDPPDRRGVSLMTPPLGTSTSGRPSARRTIRIVTDIPDQPRGQGTWPGDRVLVAVIILLVSAILLIVWRSRRQKAGTITHDIFTGPYGEGILSTKVCVWSLQEVQKFLTAPAVLRPSSLCSSPRLGTHRTNGYRLNTTLPIHPSQMGVEGGSELDKNGLYSEPYHMTYNSLSGYSSMAHKLTHPNPLSSPDYTECPSTEYAIPHLGADGATGVYPPPLPHTKPPMHTLNTFLGKPTPTPIPPTSQQPQESFYAATEIVAQGSNGSSVGSKQGGGGGGAPLEEVKARGIPRLAITLLQQIGEGQFGEVHLGEVEDEEGEKQMVAVKTLRLEASHAVRCDFEREVEILARLRDPNIVQVVGVCSREEPLCMLVEYMEHGDLNQYLQAHIAETASPRNTHAKTLSYGCLIYMATQIASGMKYLESLNFVHRDLATRNCLVGAGHIIKISDFGMSRNLYSGDYYRIEGKALLPIRWMAWESILLGKFTTKSDVWSFAVTLWEILTMAREQPYEDLTDDLVIENVSYIYHNEARKVLLPQPTNCPKEIYDLMRECWKRSDADRPTFREIHMFLQRKNLGYSPVT
ncbi:discoidin domain-containing receptor 2-like [Homarus americanus]|uniref:discoidin domain-containing receptor 2-like n=1 Tax=Homarus americanus TaxID=6706 RepID=UPI001C43DBC1|nr:discoidin domain-containing receptor 2-like [Homarus americanus]